MSTSRKPRPASIKETPRIDDEPQPGEPKALRQRHRKAASVGVKSEDASYEQQVNTRGSIQPGPETQVPSPRRSNGKPQRSCRCLAAVQTIVKYAVGLIFISAGVMVCRSLVWSSSPSARPPWNVFSSRNPPLPKLKVDEVAAACGPSSFPDCEGIPSMLYQLNGELARTNWAIETLGYRLGDALSSMTDSASKSGCSHLRHIQVYLSTARTYGDGVRAAVATSALEEEAIQSLVALVGLDVLQDLKALVKAVSTGWSWQDLLDPETSRRRDRQWRECVRCRDALERCAGDLGMGIDMLEQEAERYAQLETTLEDIGKQIEATLGAAEGEGGHARCTMDTVQRIRQSFTQAIRRAVNGDPLSLKPPL